MRFQTFRVMSTGLAYGLICLAQDQSLGNIPSPIKTVVGAPFSAQAVTESTLVLADGNRITRQSSALIARDSQGRTRREQGLGSIFLQDPTTNTAFVLEPTLRIARRISAKRVGPTVTSGETQDTLAKKALIQRRPTDEKAEGLGTDVIDGLLAEGTRLTRTIPPEKAGNERPLDVVSESWYSTELQTIVLSKTSDPRSGETTYRLTDVRRGEPDSALFEIPADYSVETVDPGGGGKPNIN